MSVLKTLNFVVATKRNNDPVVLRRAKLITQLQQQRSLAEDPMFVAVTQRWRKGEDGEKRLVERQKRVKRWWYVDLLGQCFLTINYGSKRLELDKGKTAARWQQNDVMVRRCAGHKTGVLLPHSHTVLHPSCTPSRVTVCCLMPIVLVGLNATRSTISSPLLMPPCGT